MNLKHLYWVGMTTVFTILMLETGCSPYVYSQEVTSFSKGTAAIVTDYTSSKTAFDDLVTELKYQDYTHEKTRLTALSGCDSIVRVQDNFPPCDVVEFGNTKLDDLTPLQIEVNKAKPAIDALSNYVSNLVALTTATDDTTLSAAETKLNTSVATLTIDIGKANTDFTKTQAAEVNGVVNIFVQAAQTYLNYHRLTVLKQNVPAADAVIDQLGKAILEALLDVRAHRMQELQKEIRQAAIPLETAETVHKLKETEYRSDLNLLTSKIALFNQIRAADPKSSIQSMITAHHQLATALKNDDGQSTAVLSAIDMFLKATAQLSPTTATSVTTTTSTTAVK